MAVEDGLLDATRLRFLKDFHEPAGRERHAVQRKYQALFKTTALDRRVAVTCGRPVVESVGGFNEPLGELVQPLMLGIVGLHLLVLCWWTRLSQVRESELC